MTAMSTTSAAWLPAGSPALLGPFADAGVLADADADVATRLADLAGETDERVTLAAALAVRAPRVGHVCVELARVRDHVVVEADPHADADAVPALPWPDVGEWQAAVAASPLVGDGTPPADPAEAKPLVWHDGRLYLDRYWRYERRLADALLNRAGQPVAGAEPAGVRAALDQTRPSDDLGGAVDRQRLAIASAATHQLTVITGGPGTGKTTTVAQLMAVLHQLAGAADTAPRIALAAPTGKAAQRLTESIGQALATLSAPAWITAQLRQAGAQTLHRLLRFDPREPSRFRHDRGHRLPYDVVVVDEASMVSLPLMAKLVDAVPARARLVLLGDRDQLASIEAGAVLGDICGPGGPNQAPQHSPQVAERLERATGQALSETAELAAGAGIWDAVVRLTRFHRFGEGSEIGRVAHAIRALGGDATPAVATIAAVSSEADTAVSWSEPTAEALAPPGVLDEVVAAYRQVAVHAEAGEDAEALAALGRIRVLCAHRRGPAGVERWTDHILRQLAAQGVATDDRWFPGRPVLIGENDYTLELFNGDVGVVVAAPSDGDPQRRVVAFPAADGRLRHVRPSRLPAHETTFAMTIHKSQGSQFDHAVVALPEHDSPICTRELVYTALTRASARLTLIAHEEVLSSALTRRIQRPSGLLPALWGR